jgi:hypothetical protein
MLEHKQLIKLAASTHKLKPAELKTIRDIDIYRYQNVKSGEIESRYKTMAKLYGENNADRMIRNLEVASW